ncbi:MULTISPECIES: GreA/GreB family elongation factor [unclassified Mycolicibacterium]|uniref:GreA/GreB family elongation factor n=1 Tax=unclassified Mycolicibacterium TaxID=2636767 RepID=UPI0012DCB262|nr:MULTISPECIES: GreA/GreB family elongation factor [unclassified Mycolicibacterium]
MDAVIHPNTASGVPPARPVSPITAEQSGAVIADRNQRETPSTNRINARDELILDGQAVPGAWVTVSFNGDPEDTDVFQLVLPTDAKPLGDTCSVDCPLGKALTAAHVGETRRYTTESGRNMAITVLAVDNVNPKETAGR